MYICCHLQQNKKALGEEKHPSGWALHAFSVSPDSEDLIFSTHDTASSSMKLSPTHIKEKGNRTPAWLQEPQQHTLGMQLPIKPFFIVTVAWKINFIGSSSPEESKTK